MPVIQELVDFDADFARLDPNEVIVINDLPNRTEEDREYFNWLIKETYTNDMVSVMPRCRCGELKGEHVVGMVCDSCHQPVTQTLKDSIRPMLWFRRPQGVDALIVPHVWIMLQRRFNKKGCDIMRWLTDRTYVPQSAPQALERMIANNIPRGLNNFIRYFDDIFAYLINSKDFVSNRLLHKTMKGMVGMADEEDPLAVFIRDHRDKIFTNYIPLLNRTLIVVEKTGQDRFVEGHVIDVHNIMNSMLSIDRDHYDKTPTVIENRTAKILAMLSSHYLSYIGTNLRPKTGTYRKLTYGSRCVYSFRAVITSHEELADYDEIHVPWCIGVTVFWQHHMAILLRRDHPLGGMTHMQATQFLMDHVEKYHPVIDQLLQNLIKNSRNGTLKTSILRNPSLLQGSIQQVRLTKFKTDPRDTTVSMSDLIA